jgi:hypothetical protein
MRPFLPQLSVTAHPRPLSAHEQPLFRFSSSSQQALIRGIMVAVMRLDRPVCAGDEVKGFYRPTATSIQVAHGGVQPPGLDVSGVGLGGRWKSAPATK